MKQTPTTTTAQDYLKELYLLERKTDAKRGPIALGRLAAALSITPGTVTTMVKRFASDGLMVYTPRRGVQLTAEGERIAITMLRRHRIVETFLVQHLGLDWGEVHQEAEVLEHAISDKVLDRLDELLGRPTTDPHGDPIPDAQGNITTDTTAALSQLKPGDKGQIARIDNQGKTFLAFAAKHGLRPGAKIRVTRLTPEAETIEIKLPRQPPISLSIKAAGNIYLKPSP